MKYLMTMSLFISSFSQANLYRFNYKDKSISFVLNVEDSNYKSAYKRASKECFSKLTNGKYPGEERGLSIIDVCANPK